MARPFCNLAKAGVGHWRGHCHIPGRKHQGRHCPTQKNKKKKKKKEEEQENNINNNNNNEEKTQQSIPGGELEHTRLAGGESRPGGTLGARNDGISQNDDRTNGAITIRGEMTSMQGTQCVNNLV